MTREIWESKTSNICRTDDGLEQISRSKNQKFFKSTINPQKVMYILVMDPYL